jgi:hypothetical protein
MQIFAVILWYAVVIAAGFYNATKTLVVSRKFLSPYKQSTLNPTVIALLSSIGC